MSATETSTMKAVNYQGAFKIKVEDVPMPQIEHPDDVIVKVTTAGMFLGI
jgi:threonine dehydrogenase-like Zn-dependent dehydrogenase